MADGRKKTPKAEVEKAIKDTKKQIQKLDLELRRIARTLESAPLCQHIYMPPIYRPRTIVSSRKTKRR